MGTVRKRKRKPPYFISVELMRDGRVRLTAHDHEEYIVEMQPDDWRPLVMRCTTKRELLERWADHERERRLQQMQPPEPPPPPKYGPPKLVG